MGRAPCCEKKGLKKGPWTRDEDQLLINYINQNGHGNWRALPKKAGLLRCGKSCRLRWTNYLRPDIKRGNFTKEEEDTIIDLHKELGNKWSAIATKLPGRTDNEIKNVWHTHLKKRLNPPPEPVKRVRKRSKSNPDAKKDKKTEEVSGQENVQTQKAVETTQEITSPHHEPLDSSMQVDSQNTDKDEPNSPSQSSSENSSITTTTINGAAVPPSMSDVISETIEKFLHVDDDFLWSDVISGDYSSITSDLPAVNSEPDFQTLSSSIDRTMVDEYDFDPRMPDDMEFWYDIFTRDGEIQKLLEF